MTPAEHARQREAVRLSLMLADTPEDRKSVYPRRVVKPPVFLRPHVFVIPVVTPVDRKELL